MPLVAWGALAYALGLLVALAASGSVVVGVLAAAAAVVPAGLVAARPVAAACAALMLAGGLLGVASEADARRCRARINAAASWTVELDDAARPGGVAHGAIRAGRCRLRATLLVSTGRAAAGRRAAVRGDVSVDARGAVVRDATLAELPPTASLAALRARVGARIDRVFGRDAPLARALVIADMSSVDAAQRDRFARAGLVHMLSVSGLHVAMIALALELLASALRLPPAPARLATIVLLALYVAAIGAPPPALRAAVMLALFQAGRVAQRPTSPWAVLAVGGVVPLVQAGTVLDLGWQLSVAGTAAIVAGGGLSARLVPRTWPRAARGVARGLVVSVVATAVTAPLVAVTFGRIALLGPLTNLVADPVMAVLQPLLFLALAVPVDAVERLCADASHALVAAFEGIATTAAAVPFAAPAVLPTTLAAWAGGVMAVALVVACVAARPARAALLALGAGAVLVVEPLVAAGPRSTELHLLDVGQGDAIALRTRAGRWIVVDAGRSWPTGDAGRSIVAPYLARRGGPIALFVLSHPHADHVGGAGSLFAALRPQRFLDPGYVGTTPAYRAALHEAGVDGIPWQRVHPGDSLVIDEVTLTALAPDSAWAAHLDDANLASTVLVARVGAVRILLTGDAEAPEEDWLLGHARDALAADILKVAHHGSATSTSPSFLRAVRPRLALVSVGAHNSYGHPDAEVLDALRGSGAAVMRSDLDGTIVVRTDGRAIEVEARGVRWMLPERAGPAR